MVPFLNGLDQILFICNNYIHHVRESKTVLDSGLTPWDSGFLKLHYIAKDSEFHNKSFQDSGLHKPKFHGFRNPNSLTWGDNNVISKKRSLPTNTVYPLYFFLSFFLFFFLISGNFSLSFLFGCGNVSS